MIQIKWLNPIQYQKISMSDISDTGGWEKSALWWKQLYWGEWSLTFSFHHSTAPLQLRAVSSVTHAEAGDSSSSAPAAAGLRRDENLILWWLGLLGLNQVGKLTHHSQQNSNNMFFFLDLQLKSDSLFNNIEFSFFWQFGNCWYLLII